MSQQLNCACSNCLPLEGGSGRQIPSAKPIIAMHARYGHGSVELKCGTCQHLHRHIGRAHDYFKCHLYSKSSSAASDFRAKWPACGAYVQEQP